MKGLGEGAMGQGWVALGQGEVQENRSWEQIAHRREGP